MKPDAFAHPHYLVRRGARFRAVIAVQDVLLELLHVTGQVAVPLPVLHAQLRLQRGADASVLHPRALPLRETVA